jgi:hypothetical protein
VATFVAGIAQNNMTLAESAPGVTPQILEAGGQAALEAYAHSFHFIVTKKTLLTTKFHTGLTSPDNQWIVLIPFLVVALIGVIILKSVKEEMNQIIDRPADVTYCEFYSEKEVVMRRDIVSSQTIKSPIPLRMRKIREIFNPPKNLPAINLWLHLLAISKLYDKIEHILEDKSLGVSVCLHIENAR